MSFEWRLHRWFGSLIEEPVTRNLYWKIMMCSSSLLPEHIIIHLNGAQLAFFLPTGTPSNIVGFTIEIKDMIKTGVPLKIAGIAALSFLLPTLGKINHFFQGFSFLFWTLLGMLKWMLLQELMFLGQMEKFNSCKLSHRVKFFISTPA